MNNIDSLAPTLRMLRGESPTSGDDLRDKRLGGIKKSASEMRKSFRRKRS